MIITENINKVITINWDKALSDKQEDYLQITVINPMAGKVKVIRLNKEELNGLVQFLAKTD